MTGVITPWVAGLSQTRFGVSARLQFSWLDSKASSEDGTDLSVVTPSPGGSAVVMQQCGEKGEGELRARAAGWSAWGAGHRAGGLGWETLDTFFPPHHVQVILSSPRENLSVRGTSWWLRFILLNICLFILLFFLTTPAIIVNTMDMFNVTRPVESLKVLPGALCQLS